MSASIALPGLSARLDKLVYHHGGKCLPADQPHAFVYFVTIHNSTEHTVITLLMPVLPQLASPVYFFACHFSIRAPMFR